MSDAPTSQEVWKEGVFSPEADAFAKDVVRELSNRQDTVVNTTVRVLLRSLQPHLVEASQGPQLTDIVATVQLAPMSHESHKMFELLTSARLSYSFVPGERLEPQMDNFKDLLRKDLTSLIADSDAETIRVTNLRRELEVERRSKRRYLVAGLLTMLPLSAGIASSVLLIKPQLLHDVHGLERLTGVVGFGIYCAVIGFIFSSAVFSWMLLRGRGPKRSRLK
jgi:hypothetical protein